MNLAYTTTISINGEFVLRKGSGSGQIPDNISVREISVWPEKDTTYPIYYLKGIGNGSSYIKVEAEMPVFNLDCIADEQSIYMYIKTTSAVTFNILVKGLT